MIGSSYIPVKMDQPMLAMRNRVEYFSGFIPMWRRSVISRVLYPPLFAIGFASLFVMPFFGVIAMAAAGYFYYMHTWSSEYLKSESRKVILAK